MRVKPIDLTTNIIGTCGSTAEFQLATGLESHDQSARITPLIKFLANLRLAIVLAMTFVSVVVAQPDDRSNGGDEDGRQAIVQEQPFRVVYIKDKASGEYVPLITGVTLDELTKLLANQRARSERDRPRKVTISELKIVGEAKDLLATIDASISFSLQRPDGVENEDSDAGNVENNVENNVERTRSQWSRIHLPFLNAALLEKPTYEGEGDWVTIPNATGGYDVWNHGTANEGKITLKFSVPLTRVADTTQLSIQVPESTVSSLEFSIPGEPVTPSVENAVRRSSKHVDGKTLVVANGFDRQVILSWQKGEKNKSQPATKMTAQADVDATVERIGAITSDVAITIEAGGQTLEQFEFTLPNNGKIVSGDQPEFKIIRSESATLENNLHQVQFAVSTSTPPVVRFRFEMENQSVDAPEAGFNLAGVRVVDALRQYGTVRVRSPRDLHVQWTTSPNVTRINDPRLRWRSDRVEGTEDTPLEAAFDYSQQPCSIDITVKRQATQVWVEPVHFLVIGANQMTLSSSLRYRVRGTSTKSLELDTRGWSIDEASLGSNIREVTYENKSPYSTQLEFIEPAVGEFLIEFESRQRLTSNERLVIELPAPKADSVRPGILLVASANNVSLEYQQSEMPGFSRDVIPPALRYKADEYSTSNPVRCFRFLNSLDSKFVVDYLVKDQEIFCEIQNLISVAKDRARVTQLFNFDVRYRHVFELNLLIPKRIHESLQTPALRNRLELEIKVNDKAIPTAQIPISSSTDVESQESISIPISLSRGIIGLMKVEVRYSQPVGAFNTNDIEPFDIPLITISEGQLVTNKVIVEPEPGVNLQPSSVDQEWATIPKDGKLVATSDATLPSYQFRARLSSSSAVGESDIDPETSPTKISRAWLQTWMTGGDRQDRAVYRFQTGQSSVRIRLPNQVSIEDTEIVLDNVEVKPMADAEGEVITVPVLQKRDWHVLEVVIDYHDRPRIGRITVDVPEFLDASEFGNWVWQLVLPPNEHVLRSQRDLTASQSWSWTGWFWRRQTTQTQKSLQQWLGVSGQPSPEGANEYLYSSFKPATEVEVYTASRRTMVAFGSGLVLTFGLMVMYVKQLRRPLVLFLAATVLGILALLFPGPAVLISQASVIGVLLALIGQIVSLIISRLSTSRQFSFSPVSVDSPSVIRPIRHEDQSKVSVEPVSARAFSVTGTDSKV